MDRRYKAYKPPTIYEPSYEAERAAARDIERHQAHPSTTPMFQPNFSSEDEETDDVVIHSSQSSSNSATRKRKVIHDSEEDDTEDGGIRRTSRTLSDCERPAHIPRRSMFKGHPMPGHKGYSLTQFSITIGKRQADVPIAWWALVCQFMDQYVHRGTNRLWFVHALCMFMFIFYILCVT
jgi:hypothetical protein